MGGLAYHVLNRAVGRSQLFDDDADYLAMERVIEHTHKRLPIRIISYCLMSNHWHLVLWPIQDDELSEFMQLMTVTHTQRRHAHHHTAGTGPLYQGRFKSFPIQQDGHFLTVCRYVERNALRANLVKSARNWPWCSVAKRTRPATASMAVADRAMAGATAIGLGVLGRSSRDHRGTRVVATSRETRPALRR